MNGRQITICLLRLVAQGKLLPANLEIQGIPALIPCPSIMTFFIFGNNTISSGQNGILTTRYSAIDFYLIVLFNKKNLPVDNLWITSFFYNLKHEKNHFKKW